MVSFMGILHILMASQECGGRLLGSGWMFSTPTFFTPGVAISLLGGKHVNRTRYAHQLTLAWLNTLKMQAYHEYGHDGELWERGLVSSHNLLLTTVRDYMLISCAIRAGSANRSLTLKSIEEIYVIFSPLVKPFMHDGHQSSSKIWHVFHRSIRLSMRLSWKGSSLCNVMTGSSS